MGLIICGVQEAVSTVELPVAGGSIASLRTRPIPGVGTLIVERTIIEVAVPDSRQKAPS